MEIRRKLIEERAVDVIVSVGSNFFFTVTLPVTLWFLDRGKRKTARADEVLFIDARDIYRQIDRAHRDWKLEQIEFLANIVRLWRGEEPEFDAGSDGLLLDLFPEREYVDVPGLCATADVTQIASTGWSLSPGRYVPPAPEVAVHDFEDRIAELAEEYWRRSDEARGLESLVRSAFERVLR